MEVRFSRTLSDRELVLVIVTINVALIVGVSMWWLSPGFDVWRTTKASVDDATAEMTRLSDAFAVREDVEHQFAALGETVLRSEPDQVVLSGFLRDLDRHVREAHLTLVNMKPFDVEREVSHRAYPVRLAVAGSLPETVQFAGAVLERDAVIALDRFTIRGVQGFGRVESSFVVSLIKLEPAATTRSLPASAGSSRREPTDDTVTEEAK